jgi:nickel superoxide dismutase
MHRLIPVIAILIQLFGAQPAMAHCQIPCGIYDDSARVDAMLEDAATIAKATVMLAELQGKDDVQATNQQVRWVMNKEQTAQNVIDTIADYFLTQRVKAEQPDYVERLRKHHAVIVAAVQAKQSAAPAAAKALKKAIEALRVYYPAHPAHDP